MSIKLGKPITYFYQDIFIVTGAPLYAGFISNIGLIIWSVTVGVCFFSFLVLRNILEDRKLPWFFFISGLFTLLLLFDDFFLFHEVIYPRYFSLNPTTTYVIYACLALVYLWYFRKTILTSDYLILITALGFFFMSNILDEFRERFLSDPNWIILEDGPKLLGITSWLIYFTFFGVKAIRDSLKSQTDSAL
jgi:hypothetical protein